jgi:hypothetical protein
MAPEVLNNALYVRVHLSNSGPVPARECRIFVERIHYDGQLIEDEQSPVIWTDIDNFDARTIDAGGGSYADVCSVYRSAGYLQVHSLKGRKGYGRLSKRGVYVFEISAKDLASENVDYARLEVTLGGDDWHDLGVLSRARTS